MKRIFCRVCTAHHFQCWWAMPTLLLMAASVVTLFLVETNPVLGQRSRSRSRRSQRVKMQQVQVTSPDGNVKLTILPNAERLSFTVTMGETVVIDPSTIIIKLDGYDLSSGVVLGNVERYEINETYPWHGSHSTAFNKCIGAKISLQHDLSFTNYVLELRVFNDGAAFRHIIPGDEDASRVPDEYTTFVIPAESMVWYHDLGGHYEAAYKNNDISDIPAGQWAGPPVTFKLPYESGYGLITEANLVNYAGMALEADDRYNASLVCDNKENDAAVVLMSLTASEGDKLTIEMSNGGGFVGRFSEK